MPIKAHLFPIIFLWTWLAVPFAAASNPLEKVGVYREIFELCEEVVRSRSTGPLSDFQVYSKRKRFPQLNEPHLSYFQTMFLHPSHEFSISVVESEADTGSVSWSCGYLTNKLDDAEFDALIQWFKDFRNKLVASGVYEFVQVESGGKVKRAVSCSLGVELELSRTRKIQKWQFIDVRVNEASCAPAS